MRKAALIISIIELCISPLILWGCYNFLRDFYKTLEVNSEVPIEAQESYELILNSFIVTSVILIVLGIVFFIVAQILISKKSKIAAGILTIIFVSKIAGVLTFFIKYDDNKAIDNNESNSSVDTL